MNVHINAARYVCRDHSEALIESEGQAHCGQCERSYNIHDGIWMLDLMNRPDRAAFDEQVRTNPIPLDLKKAPRMLTAAGIDSLRHANILDVGCGLGDLTCGLARSASIFDSDIYAFDHSIESLRMAAAVSVPMNSNRVHFSAQDAMQLFFADDFFDLIAGSAVLHHFLDYPGFLREAARILKPGGTVVFAEPFFEGYFWPTFFLKNAIEECGLDTTSPEFSDVAILKTVHFMSRHRGNVPALADLTDKHFFRESELLAAAAEAGFSAVRFAAYEPPEFYNGWIPYFLDLYGVKRPEVRQAVVAKYDCLIRLAGPLLPDLMSHFKYIVLRKANH
jgi:ubiquinone/menaquinone biosynthesis C-methylase UbiE